MKTREGSHWQQELEQCGIHIDQFTEEANQTAGTNRDQVLQNIQSLREKQAEARARVQKLQNSGEDAENELKVEAAQAMADFKLAIAKARKLFDKN